MLFNIIQDYSNSTKTKQQEIKNNKQMNEYEIIDFPKYTKTHGNYKGRYPKEAAEKAFTFLSNLVGDDIDNEGTFLVFALNNKKTNKTYKFIGTRIELENPVVNNQNMTKRVKYKNVISNYNPVLDNIKPSKIIK